MTQVDQTLRQHFYQGKDANYHWGEYIHSSNITYKVFVFGKNRTEVQFKRLGDSEYLHAFAIVKTSPRMSDLADMINLFEAGYRIGKEDGRTELRQDFEALLGRDRE